MPTATSRSRTSPFCFFVPLAYSALNLFASRFLVAMSSPPSIRQASPAPGHAGRYFALTIYDEQTRISRSNITTNVGCGQASFYNRACNLHGKWVPSLRKGTGAWLLCLFGNALFRPRRWDLGEDSDGWA